MRSLGDREDESHDRGDRHHHHFGHLMGGRPNVAHYTVFATD